MQENVDCLCKLSFVLKIFISFWVNYYMLIYYDVITIHANPLMDLMNQ